MRASLRGREELTARVQQALALLDCFKKTVCVTLNSERERRLECIQGDIGFLEWYRPRKTIKRF
jgi:hypothetical protein